MKTTFALTSQIELAGGAHILYFFGSSDAYISNAAAFIRDGLLLGQHILLIDSPENHALIRQKLLSEKRGFDSGYDEERIQYIDHRSFYTVGGSLHARHVLDNVYNLYMQDCEVRSWGHVYWEDQANIHKQLSDYEHLCEETIDASGILGLFAYDAAKVPVNLQIDMLKSHEYMMTDSSIARSPFYEKAPAVFPSPLVQDQLNLEMDLYRQKLDFVHAVSHEVRNPLTVIKAYAKMLLYGSSTEADREKLQAIADYVDVIDYEITHIINTEQMLSTDSLWVRTEIELFPIVMEVTEMMAVKARTQNIALYTDIGLMDERTLGNAIGLKLIVSNLLSNAIKYSEEDGAVWLKACRGEDGELVVRCRDEGCGMTKEQLDKLFRKYEKMNTEKSGQGIGLFMVKKLVDHFGGTIELASEPNRGTTATVRLRQV